MFIWGFDIVLGLELDGMGGGLYFYVYTTAVT